MKRYVAALVGLFCFSTLVGCAAEPTTEDAESAAAAAVYIADAPDLFEKAEHARAAMDLPCIAGNYTSTSSWTRIELLPDGKGIRTETLHDGRNASFAQSGVRWSATNRTIVIGMEIEPMRFDANCRFAWFGDVKYARVD